jgi:glutamate carboxypeptidase
MGSSSDSIEAARAASSWAASRSAEFERRLKVLVNIDSGVDDPAGREQVAALLAGWAREAGCATELVPTPQGSHLDARLHGNGEGRIVLLGHHDTVFAHGVAAERPFSSRGGRAYGPGVADMKGGLLVGLAAIESLARGQRPFASVELHSVSDEEVRSDAFAELDRLRGAQAVLVLECGRENGDLVVGRKTAAWVRLHVAGRAAHAGTDPQLGRNAVVGLCREIMRCDALNGAREGLTLVPGTIVGGTLVNVVPESAEAAVDVRAVSSNDLRWALEEIADLQLGDGLEGSLELNRAWPGIEPNPGTQIMFSEVTKLSGALGMSVGGQTSGGVSDGCWTSEVGVPTLDGLGPVGGRDHSPQEYIALGSVPERCALIAGLCIAIGDGLLSGLVRELDEGASGTIQGWTYGTSRPAAY